MKTWLSGKTVVCGLAILLGACGGDDEGEGGSGLAGCSDVCAKIAPLMCANDSAATCQAECDSLDDQAPNCASQARAFVACSAARPATDFACSVDGEGELVATACTTESNAFAACVFGGLAGMNGGGTGGTSGGGAGTGGGTCEFTNDGECDEPDFCPPGTDTADCS
jgi:hypothetical protein